MEDADSDDSDEEDDSDEDDDEETPPKKVLDYDLSLFYFFHDSVAACGELR